MPAKTSSTKFFARNMSMSMSLSFSFDLPKSSLHYVDEDLSRLSTALETAKVIGMDTETEPTKFNGRQHPTSIIQLAIRFDDCEEVFVVDLLTISKNLALLSELNEMMRPPFLNHRVVKIGQSLVNDLRELATQYPTMSCFVDCNGILDTTIMHRVLNPEIARCVSLKDITRSYLHFELDKTHQMSHWGKRPLSSGQINYAACDALVLLRLYDVMICEAEDRADGVFDIQQVLISFNFSKKRKMRTEESANPVQAILASSSSRLKLHSPTERAWFEGTLDKDEGSSDEDEENIAVAASATGSSIGDPIAPIFVQNDHSDSPSSNDD